MEIIQALRNGVMEMQLVGRLDALWADHVAAAVSGAIRAGHHRIALDMAGVEFLSSAGIGVITKFNKQLRGIGGNLAVVRPSPFVADVLACMGLKSLIGSEDALAAQRSTLVFPCAERMETENATFKVDRTEAADTLTCRVLGDAAALGQTADKETTCQTLTCTQGMFALGIGAPGESYEECRARFGEFLAVDGAVAFLPSGHGHAPDFLLARGTFVPRIQVLHGLSCAGPLSVAVSFQARPEQSVSLSEVVQQCLKAAQCDTIGIVMAAEIDGLVGAWLRRSPVDAGVHCDPFAFPEIRDFLRFTAERAYTSEVALVAGVAARAAPAPLFTSVRPLDAEETLLGHVHAAAFTYHPLCQRGMGMAETVKQLFEWQTLRGLLHLLHDSRPAEGIGQSEFLRGTCWVQPIGCVINGDHESKKGN